MSDDWGDFSAFAAAPAAPAATSETPHPTAAPSTPATTTTSSPPDSAAVVGGTPNWLLGGLATTPNPVPIPSANVKMDDSNFGDFASSSTAAAPTDTNNFGDFIAPSAQSTQPTALAAPTTANDFGSFATPAAHSVETPTTATAGPATAAAVENAVAAEKAKYLSLQETLTKKVSDIEHNKTKLESLYADLKNENEALQQKLSMSTGNAAESHQLLNQLREKHESEIKAEQQSSTSHLAKITAEFQAQTKAIVAEEQKKSELLVQSAWKEAQEKCFALMKSQQTALSGILSQNILEIKATVDATVADAVEVEKAKLDSSIAEAVSTATSTLETKVLDAVTAASQKNDAKYDDTVDSLRKNLETMFAEAKSEAASDAAEHKKQLSQHIAEELLKAQESLSSKMEDERIASKDVLDSCVNSKAEELQGRLEEAFAAGSSKVEAAVDAGKQALISAVESTKQQAKVEGEAASRIRLRHFAGLKMFLDTAQSQLSMLREADTEPVDENSSAVNSLTPEANADSETAEVEY